MDDEGSLPLPPLRYHTEGGLLSREELLAEGVNPTLLRRVLNPEDNSVFLFSWEKFASEEDAIVPLIVATLAFFLIRYTIEKNMMSLYRYLSCTLLKRRYSKVREKKFAENAWYTCYYIVAAAYGSLVIYWDGWAPWDTPKYWIDWPIQPMRGYFKFYYRTACGFYLHSLVALLLFDTKRDDFRELVCHHCTTIFVVVVSYWTRFHRIGIVVFVLHDLVDIFLYFAKGVVYVVAGPHTLTDVLFALFTLAFFLLRNVFFPLFPIASALREGPLLIARVTPWLRWPPTIALCILEAMHIYWLCLIIKMIKRALVGKKIDSDIRSDSEEEEHYEKEKVTQEPDPKEPVESGGPRRRRKTENS